jgi:hypothetical protein
MPAPEGGLWRSFTNVLYFNGVLMMPTYAGVDPELQRTAAETYRRLLPNWEIEGIDCTKLIHLGGAVHCVTLNLPDLKRPDNRPVRANHPPSQSVRTNPVMPTMFMSEDNPSPFHARPFEAD